jgi:hypothetical protein
VWSETTFCDWKYLASKTPEPEQPTPQPPQPEIPPNRPGDPRLPPPDPPTPAPVPGPIDPEIPRPIIASCLSEAHRSKSSLTPPMAGDSFRMNVDGNIYAPGVRDAI